MTLRELEADSIRAFVESCSEHFTGRVLDYGAGKMPYADLVRAAGGVYVPFDRASFPANVSGLDMHYGNPLAPRWDAIILTQTLQYVADPDRLLFGLWVALRDSGYLIATGPTNWPVVEPEDLHRHTVAGITRLLYEAGFTSVDVAERAHVEFEGERWPIGWQAVARA